MLPAGLEPTIWIPTTRFELKGSLREDGAGRRRSDSSYGAGAVQNRSPDNETTSTSDASMNKGGN